MKKLTDFFTLVKKLRTFLGKKCTHFLHGNIAYFFTMKKLTDFFGGGGGGNASARRERHKPP